MNIVLTTRPAVSGLGSIKSRRAARKARRKAAGGAKGFRKFMGVLTGGLYNIATNPMIQKAGKAKIVVAATQEETAQDLTLVDEAINISDEEAFAAIDQFSTDSGGAGEDLNLFLEDQGIALDMEGTTGGVEILDSGYFAAQLANFPQGDVEKCNCLIGAVASVSVDGPMDTLMIQQGMLSCLTDPKVAMANAAAAGVDIEQCKPWYLRKNTLIVGGVVLGGVVFIRMRK